jgi:flagellar L-ring protein precursor FlgH
MSRFSPLDLWLATFVRRIAILIALCASASPKAWAQSKDKEKDATPRRVSWTADRREFVVGDIITVLLDEATIASTAKAQQGSDQTSRDNDVGITPPKIGTTALPSIDAQLSTAKQAQSKQEGRASRNLNFQGDITVRVVGIKDGVIQLKGTKTVDVDKNKQTLTFSGFVRPQDVRSNNVVESARVADAQMSYSLSGNLGKTRGGIIGRLISVFWP